MPATLFDKIWAGHEIPGPDDGPKLLYVDRHLIHEVSSPQAFEALRIQGRSVRRPDLSLAIADHNVSTAPDRLGGTDTDPESREQIAALEANARAAGIAFLGLDHPDQGIVHVVGPELGFSLPGSVIVCGDSHTTAHGAFGALAFGIGTTDIEHVLATQTLAVRRPRTMRIVLNGSLAPGVGAKDVILRVIGAIGASGAIGHVIEFAGPIVEAMSMEARMTLANMSVEAGARASLIAPDETTFAYLKDRPLAPQGADWDAAVASWRGLVSDPGAHFDAEHRLDLGALSPQVTWGLSPENVVDVDGVVPDPAAFPASAAQIAETLDYMGLRPGQAIGDVAIDHVFIGSCTNSRIEDLRAAASILEGRHVAAGVKRALVVPGSGRVKRQAEAEGLDILFKRAGFEWREPGCSACIGMNPDRLPAGARCASTSNRNFRNRQGDGVRTHLVSPLMAAAAALAGRLADARDFL